MELYIAIAVVLVVGGYFLFKRTDKNNDGKIDASEIAAVKEEVKIVAAKTATRTKATVGQAKVALKKAAAKKPAPKKAAPKKAAPKK